MRSDRYDAVVVGSGPNGLVAALRLAQAGREVLVLEAAATIGGGLRSAPLTEPGIVHDVCAAVHPLGVASPALRVLPLADHGLAWVQPEAPLAHVLDGGRAVIVERSVEETAAGLGPDGAAYRRWIGPLARRHRVIVDAVLSPRTLPRDPFALSRFAAVAIRPAASVARGFSSDPGQALIAGVAAHGMQPLDALGTGGYATLLLILAHGVGWPIAQGGSQRIAKALAALLARAGGRVTTSTEVRSRRDIPPARQVLLDLSPRQVVRILGSSLPSRAAGSLARFRHGPGAYKVDWALDGPIPWCAPGVARAATVHVGGTFAEIARAEAEVHAGRHPEHPFVILVQPSSFDPSRAPAGRHVVWAYCHVPNGSTVDRTAAIEGQIERFAPGFRDRIVARHVMGPADLEGHDANYVGGDIGGGAGDLRQVLARPVLSWQPWVLPLEGTFLCSASTPPGPGVHGMCGLLAANAALRRERA